jgi:hemolysin III
LVLRDPFSSLSHAAGLVLALYVWLLLVRLARGQELKRAVGCFGFCLCLQYAASAAYHAVVGPEELVDFLRRLDHSAIHILIAGTYTPLLVVSLRGRARAAMLALTWSLAAAGVASKWLLPFSAYHVSLVLFAASASVAMLVPGPLARGLGRSGLALALAGGACYLTGGVCDVLGWPGYWPGVFSSHDLLHVLDLAGSGLHVTLAVRLVTRGSRGVPAPSPFPTADATYNDRAERPTRPVPETRSGRVRG